MVISFRNIINFTTYYISLSGKKSSVQLPFPLPLNDLIQFPIVQLVVFAFWIDSFQNVFFCLFVLVPLMFRFNFIRMLYRQFTKQSQSANNTFPPRFNDKQLFFLLILLILMYFCNFFVDIYVYHMRYAYVYEYGRIRS